MQVVTIETPDLGDRSYLIHDGSTGVVIDPQRDIDRMTSAIDQAGVLVALVAETHMHNDYVSGGLQLARQLGATYVTHVGDPVAFDRTGVRDGDRLEAGTMTVAVVATPGHTPNHLSYVVTAPGEVPLLFSGGNLLYGSVGRTDLVAPELTEELTHHQYHSARKMAEVLPDDAVVFPTHGFGSFCSSGATEIVPSSTIGVQRRGNPAFTTDDEEAFVTELIAGLAAYPRYYAHMGPANLAGAGPVDLDRPIEPVDAEVLRSRLAAGEWVVDVRARTAYAAKHLRGTISIELGDEFATYVGWVLPYGEPITLVADSALEVAQARRALARIGIDQLAGATDRGIDAVAAAGTVTTYDRAQWEHLCDTLVDCGDHPPVVLDVRREDEHAAGHVHGAINIPVFDLLRRIDEIPPGDVWVHCRSGFRAGLAASILERAGRRVVHVDDLFERAEQVGVTLALPVAAR